MVYAQAALLGDIPLMDSPLSVNTKARGEELARILGAGPAVLLKAHGATIVGADMVECFALATYLEENAYRQYMAMQIGEPYVFSAEEQRISRKNLGAPHLLKEDVGPFLFEAGPDRLNAPSARHSRPNPRLDPRGEPRTQGRSSKAQRRPGGNELHCLGPRVELSLARG